MFGKLTVICGCMYSGKTSTMMIEARKINAVVFKPAFDTRYSTNECVSHDGECIPAHAISSLADVAQVGETKRPYAFDEVQFLDEDRYAGDFVADVKALLACGVEVVACGLDMTASGEPFPVVAKLMAMADHVVKLGAVCTVCGSYATKSFKKSHRDTVVELGSGDLYEARCNRHWQ